MHRNVLNLPINNHVLYKIYLIFKCIGYFFCFGIHFLQIILVYQLYKSNLFNYSIYGLIRHLNNPFRLLMMDLETIFFFICFFFFVNKKMNFWLFFFVLFFKLHLFYNKFLYLFKDKIFNLCIFQNLSSIDELNLYKK